MGWWARNGRSEPRLNEKGDDARSRRGGKKWEEEGRGEKENEGSGTNGKEGKERKGKESGFLDSFERKFVERESKRGNVRAYLNEASLDTRK